jgi:FKBP-type peptidyl-prolyl cis-trans isomerase
MKSGIRIIEDQPGTGPSVVKGDRIRIVYDLFLNRGDPVQSNFETEMVLGDRSVIAGLNYGIEGMRQGGRRRFRASPHLCYREEGVPGTIPADAVLVFDVRLLEIKGRTSTST